MLNIDAHISEVLACKKCPGMIGPAVTHHPLLAKIYLVGQAPGPREGQFGRPFAWTAGKMLFRWFETQGVDEKTFRANVFMAAVCRCFPGKAKGGGDRVPSPDEIDACSGWMEREIAMMKPELIIPVGRLAIEQFFPPAPLAEIVGKKHVATKFGHACDAIPLPHPSGASTWFKMEPGKTLTEKALKLIGKHPAWKRVLSAKR
ncbi:MAG TPA: uracil-DNA glycosylase family protein [Planctomycetota bacterium]|nr:uracil-DNA glycosylase family protein [Planctomycetota bacterium]